MGRAIVARLAADGWSCLFTGRSEARPDGLAGDEYVSVELTDRAATEEFAAQLRERKPAILVNNAGRNMMGATVSYTSDTYDQQLELNLRAPFLLMQAVIPGMVEAGWGRIVNITSIWGVTPHTEDAAYSASKFGLDGMSASIAAEVARSDVLVNCVAPGYIETEQTHTAFTDEQLEEVCKDIPVGRLGRPEEIAAVVSWLVSRENTYVTGQNLLVDGGLTRTARR
jgi:NAD(P)-dependent dehydrogenase (short-subunit alcohol dehydrogenase family)